MSVCYGFLKNGQGKISVAVTMLVRCTYLMFCENKEDYFLYAQLVTVIVLKFVYTMYMALNLISYSIEGEYVPKAGDEVTYKVILIPPKMEKRQAVHVKITHLAPGVSHEKWDSTPDLEAH